MKGETYEEFVEKFKQKKTTDDCYTPPTIYEIVKEWACREYGIDPAKIVRPFYPGGDYQAFDYSGGAVVVDNPPFSILSEICSWYIKHKIQFFLFAPSLTCFSARKNFKQMNHIITSCEIVYENGACVKTSFVNNFGDGIVAQTAPKLSKMIDEESKRLARKDKKELPKYSYPDYIVTAALMQRYCRYGIEWKIEAKDCVQVAALDAQKQTKRLYLALACF